MSWETDLQDWADTRTAAAPTEAEAAHLIARAKNRRPSPARIGLSVAVALAAAILLWFTVAPSPHTTGWTWTPRAPAVVAPEVLAQGSHHLADDIVEVGEATTVRPLRTGPTTKLRLDAGTIALTVSPRAAGETFSVHTDSWAVTVIGTRFTVQQAPFEVRVSEGTVAVTRTGSGDRWLVKAGEWFADGRLHRPEVRKKKPPPPSLDSLQQMVLDGDLDTARTHLKVRLESSPDDARAWRLLAQLEARAGNTKATTNAWLQVVDHGSPTHAQAARFEAARLLASEPTRVVPLLEAFLQSPHPLAADARLRLADAYASLGQDGRARAILEDTVARHAGTAAAAEAQRRLR